MINSSTKIILKDKADKISLSESKKLDRESRKTERAAKRWTFERHETEKLPVSESKWISIYRSETVKSVRRRRFSG